MTVTNHNPRAAMVPHTSQAFSILDAINDPTPTGDTHSTAVTILLTAALMVCAAATAGAACGPREDRAQPNNRLNVMMPSTFVSTAAAAMLSGTTKRATCRSASAAPPLLMLLLLLPKLFSECAASCAASSFPTHPLDVAILSKAALRPGFMRVTSTSPKQIAHTVLKV